MTTKIETSAQKITPFLWFNGRVEEGINFYTSVFKDSKAGNIRRLPAETPDKQGKALYGTFWLNGLEFMILDGGPQFTFNPSVSFFVKCETQQEVDYYWEKLQADGGAPSQCGWLTDKFGLSWQIVPNTLMRLMGDPDPVKANNVMQAMMKMSKIDIAAIEKAYNEVNGS